MDALEIEGEDSKARHSSGKKEFEERHSSAYRKVKNTMPFNDLENQLTNQLSLPDRRSEGPADRAGQSCLVDDQRSSHRGDANPEEMYEGSEEDE